MRIRASMLTMLCAVLTVAVLIGTGVVLGQQDRGQAEAALLGSTPDFPAPVSADATAVANALPAEDANDSPEQPLEQSAPAIESAPADPGMVTEDQKSPSPSPPTTRPGGSDVDESTGSDVDSDESDEETADPDHDEDDESAEDESQDDESHDDE